MLEALFLFGQAVCLCALGYGCYLSLKNAHLGDEQSVERESCASLATKDGFMTIAWKTRKVWLSAALAGIGMATVALVSTDLLSGTVERPQSTLVTTVASPSEFTAATTAVPVTLQDSRLVSDGAFGTVETLREVTLESGPGGVPAPDHAMRPCDELVVRLDDGRSLTIVQNEAEHLAPGQRVIVLSGRRGAHVEQAW